MQRIVLTVGLPGSGKSTHLKRLGVPTLSSDSIRELLADDENDQTIHARVFATLRYLLRHRIAIGRTLTYLDATNLSRKERRTWIVLATENNCQIEALYFDTPLDVCLIRNRQRTRCVPDDVIRAMASKIVVPLVAEGFSKVEIITP